MPPVVNTGLLSKDARSEFLNRFMASDGTALYRDLATEIKSTRDIENYRWLGTVPRMREWGNGRLVRGLRAEAYNVENLKYEATLEVDRDEISDDQTGQIRIRIAELALAAATHKDYLVAQLLLNGATAGFNAYDGVSFFNTAHVSGASGNQSNKLSSDIVTPAAPTTAEFKDSFRQAVAAMLAFKDDRGDPMLGMNTNGLVAVVSPQNLYPAMEAMNASIINNTSNVTQGAARVVASPWLPANHTKWYLGKTDGVVRPFVFQNREAIEFGSLEAGSEEEFRREKYLYGVRGRYAMTYGYWQYCIETTFT